MGIIGTVMGLISVLSKGLEDTSSLAKDISLAFIATLYGVFTANIVWLPFESKIRVKAAKEKMVNEMIVEGLLSIQAGDSPNIIKDKLCLSLMEKMSGDKKAEMSEQLKAQGVMNK
jgi:chemotaxis protein MotA